MDVGGDGWRQAGVPPAAEAPYYERFYRILASHFERENHFAVATALTIPCIHEDRCFWSHGASPVGAMGDAEPTVACPPLEPSAGSTPVPPPFLFPMICASLLELQTEVRPAGPCSPSPSAADSLDGDGAAACTGSPDPSVRVEGPGSSVLPRHALYVLLRRCLGVGEADYRDMLGGGSNGSTSATVGEEEIVDFLRVLERDEAVRYAREQRRRARCSDLRERGVCNDNDKRERPEQQQQEEEEEVEEGGEEAEALARARAKALDRDAAASRLTAALKGRARALYAQWQSRACGGGGGTAGDARPQETSWAPRPSPAGANAAIEQQLLQLGLHVQHPPSGGVPVAAAAGEPDDLRVEEKPEVQEDALAMLASIVALPGTRRVVDGFDEVDELPALPPSWGRAQPASRGRLGRGSPTPRADGGHRGPSPRGGRPVAPALQPVTPSGAAEPLPPSPSKPTAANRARPSPDSLSVRPRGPPSLSKVVAAGRPAPDASSSSSACSSLTTPRSGSRSGGASEGGDGGDAHGLVAPCPPLVVSPPAAAQHTRPEPPRPLATNGVPRAPRLAVAAPQPPAELDPFRLFESPPAAAPVGGGATWQRPAARVMAAPARGEGSGCRSPDAHAATAPPVVVEDDDRPIASATGATISRAVHAATPKRRCTSDDDDDDDDTSGASEGGDVSFGEMMRLRTHVAGRRRATTAPVSRRGRDRSGRAVAAPSPPGRQRIPFSEAEDRALCSGYARFGGKFSSILAAYRDVFAPHRTACHLYDHWRAVLRQRALRQ